jgi:sodium transport system permease protein
VRKLRPATVLALYRAELRMALRDRRMVFFSILLPLAVMPVVLFSSLWAQRQRDKEVTAKVQPFALLGTAAQESQGWVSAAVNEPAANAGAARVLRFRERAVVDGERALRNGDLSLYLIAERPARRQHDRVHPTGASVDAPRLTLVFRSDREDSRRAKDELASRLRRVLTRERLRLLERRGLHLPLDEPARLTEVNLASPRQAAGLALGRFITVFLLLFIFTGAAVLATDSLAGEKERGTLETLLASAAEHREIISAKFLVVLTSALTITAIQAINFALYVRLRIVPTGGDLAAAVTPATAGVLFALYLPVVALVSSLLLLTSGWARSYKEAQLYFMPVMLCAIAPALAALLPSIRLRSAIALVPIANIAVAVKEILSGRYDWPGITVAWLVTAGAALAMVWTSARLLRNERLVCAAETITADLASGPAHLERHVLRAFAIMWALMLVGSSYVGNDVRFQLLFNIIGVMLGGSALLIRSSGLDPRVVLAFRSFKKGVWLALVAGVPGGLLSSIGVLRLVDLVVPTPARWFQEFARSLLPPDLPFWQALLLISVLPGIGEEIAFRGVLLHGLHRRLRPVPLVIAVGAVFGLFHIALPRLAPTAFLGMLITGATLLSGSIYPAMLWHALSNALSLLTADSGFPLNALPGDVHVCGALLLVIAFWVLWRCRTPYPGLRLGDRSRSG